MKKRFQKLTSFVLVLVMLLTMIPAGIFTATAEEDIITIGTKKEWENLAKQNLDFEGKTVQLTATIFGITMPLADTFKGTFDGCGNFIFSASIANGQGVIANTLSGNATVQNVKFEAATVNNYNQTDGTGSPTGIIAGNVIPSEGSTITIANVNVDTFYSDEDEQPKSVIAGAPAGGLIGQVATASNYTLDICNVWIKANVQGKTTGGLIGKVGDDATVTSGANITVTDSVISLASTKATSGIVGDYLGAKYAKDDTASKLSLTNVAVIGSGYSYLVSNTSSGIMNFSYKNFFVTSARGVIFKSSSYDSYINGVHCKDATKVDRKDPTIANIADMAAIEAPRLMNETDWETYFAADVDTNGYIDYRFDPAEIADYETTEVFEIGSLEAWHALAGKDHNFAGKKVVLTADIDANGGVLPTFALNFAGDFDGQGHVVKNAVMSGGVIADVILGSSDIRNLRVEKVTINTTGNAGILAGSLIGAVDTHVTISNISAVACSIVGKGTAGGLLGLLDVYNQKVSVTAEDVTTDFYSTIDISNVYIQAAVQSTEAGCSTGGLIGTDNSAGTSEKHTVTTNISDTVTYCDVKSQSNACGLIGYYAGGNTKNGNGVLQNATNNAFLNLKNIGVSGGEKATYEVLFMNNGVLNVSNFYLFDISGKLFGASAYGSWYNGVNMNEIGRANVTAVQMAKVGLEVPVQVKSVADLPLMTDDGFINYVPEKIQVVGIQQSVEIDETYALRFIAPMYVTNVSDVTMTVVATYTVNGVEENRVFTSTATMYNALTAYNKHNISDKKIIYASDFGAQKLAGFTIYNIPADSKITYTATMTYTMNGEVITSKPVSVVIDLSLPNNIGAFMGWNDAPEMNAEAA